MLKKLILTETVANKYYIRIPSYIILQDIQNIFLVWNTDIHIAMHGVQFVVYLKTIKYILQYYDALYSLLTHDKFHSFQVIGTIICIH